MLNEMGVERSAGDANLVFQKKSPLTSGLSTSAGIIP
jgi:hypothetical protein